VEYRTVCMSYLESIGAGLDFLDDLNDMSPDPMNDLIDEAFHHPISLSPIPVEGLRQFPPEKLIGVDHFQKLLTRTGRRCM
jgi:hypothetical protein